MNQVPDPTPVSEAAAKFVAMTRVVKAADGNIAEIAFRKLAKAIDEYDAERRALLMAAEPLIMDDEWEHQELDSQWEQSPWWRGY